MDAPATQRGVEDLLDNWATAYRGNINLGAPSSQPYDLVRGFIPDYDVLSAEQVEEVMCRWFREGYQRSRRDVILIRRRYIHQAPYEAIGRGKARETVRRWLYVARYEFYRRYVQWTEEI